MGGFLSRTCGYEEAVHADEAGVGLRGGPPVFLYVTLASSISIPIIKG